MKPRKKKKPLYKRALSALVFERMTLPIGKAAVDILVTHFLNVCRDKLLEERSIVLPGLGKFEVHLRGGYTFRSALHKRELLVRPRLEVQFYPAPALKKRLKELTEERGYHVYRR